MEMTTEIQQFIEVFLLENDRLNLSAARTPEELSLHIEDSMVLSSVLSFVDGVKLLDVGSGGGFPGLVLAFLHPGVQVTLLDSIQKKCDALERMARELGISNVTVLCGRAEEVAHDAAHRAHYDIVTARAVAALPTLLELCTPFVQHGGKFVAWKGPMYQEEIQQSAYALKELSTELSEIHSYGLSSDKEWGRVLLVFSQVRPVSEIYPREVGMPNKFPLLQ